MKVIKWNDGTPTDMALWKSIIKNIFFESSVRKKFSGEEERETFWNKWTAHYFANEMESLYLAIKNENVVGYLMGCRDSAKASFALAQENPSLEIFADQFKKYPAHLHINFSGAARGLGGGHLLVSAFAKDLSVLSIPGVHIITSPAARNVRFYLREGFDVLLERPWKDTPLLFMGRDIS